MFMAAQPTPGCWGDRGAPTANLLTSLHRRMAFAVVAGRLWGGDGGLTAGLAFFLAALAWPFPAWG